MLLGAIAGVIIHSFGPNEQINVIVKNLFEPIGQIFLRLIFMIVVPMVFCGLVVGSFELGQYRSLGRVVSKTMLYTVIASTTSVLIGIGLVNTLKPGQGFQIPADFSQTSTQVEKVKTNAQAAKPLVQALVEIIPKNPIEAASKALDGEIIALMFFALFFGIALSRVTKDEKAPLILNLSQIYDVCMKIVEFAMRFAPLAVFCLVFQSVYKFGFDLIKSLAYYVAVVVGGLLIQQFVIYSAMLKTFTRISPTKFFAACKDVYIYAFSTASSNATLPKSLETADKVLGLPKAISKFVLTVGSTANQNGTALFEGVTVLFLAQVYNVDLTVVQQVQVVLMSILAGIGTAGVPGGSLPLIMIVMSQVGVPAEGLGLILGVDRFLDMCRSTINVSGDLVITALVSDTAPNDELLTTKRKIA